MNLAYDSICFVDVCSVRWLQQQPYDLWPLALCLTIAHFTGRRQLAGSRICGMLAGQVGDGIV